MEKLSIRGIYTNSCPKEILILHSKVLVKESVR